MIRIPRSKQYLNDVIALAENLAAVHTFDDREMLSLTLAAEEIFIYLCRTGSPEQTVDIADSGGPHYVQLDFIFSETELDFRAFNLTYKPDYENEEGIAEIGLLLASRQVDQFSLVREPNRMLRLAIVKEKRYPSADRSPHIHAGTAAGKCAVRLAGPAEAEVFAGLAAHYFAATELPAFLKYPGKTKDMVSSGEYVCAIAEDDRGEQCGGIVWQGSEAKTMECFGPYIFGRPERVDLSSSLLEACLNDLAKTSAVGLINRYTGNTLPPGYFDELGSYSVYNDDNSTAVQVVYFRQLREDPGAKVWADPSLDDFLIQEYRRLVLPREVEFVVREDADRSGYSVLTTRTQREQGAVALSLLWPGKDMEQNISRHVKLLEEENWRNISAEIDLGIPWQAGFAPALLKNGFMPRIVLPHAGQGDVVIFRRPVALDPLVPSFVKSFEPYIPSQPGDVLKKRYHYDVLYRLNNNENALGPPPAARKMLDDFPSFDAAFYPSGDCYHLRLKLAEFYGLHPDQFIVGNGANEAITLLIKSFCEMGDNIITADKTYGGYEWVARFSGIGAAIIPLKDLAFDAEAMLNARDGRSKIIFVCNPNNPTGTYWTRGQLTDLLRRVSGSSIVVLDEAYFEFVDKDDYVDGMSLIGRYPNLVIFRTFSKMYGLAGLRIGYLAGDMDVVNIIRRTAVVYSVNALAQVAAQAALGDTEHIERTREMVAEAKTFLHNEISLLGLEAKSGEGNFLTVRLPFSDSLAYRIMMQKGVMVRMMTPFRFPNCIRITMGQAEAMEVCVDALTQALKWNGEKHG